MGSNHSSPNLQHRHDKGYKYLLSSKKIFLELLQSFIHKDWVREIKETDLINVDKSYILPDFSEKESDLVYQAKLLDRNIIFYILVELQSTVDFQMPYRLLSYQLEIWRDVLKNTERSQAERKDFKLPAIVPIVLYNGAAPWTASRSFREALAGQELFGDELLDFSYILLDVKRYSQRELLHLSNVIGAVFLLEQSADLEKVPERLHRLMDTIQSMSIEQQQRFFTWLTQVVGSQLPSERRHEIEQILSEWKTKGEVDMISNVERLIKESLDKRLEDGLLKGLQRGIQQGIEQGIEREKLLIAQSLIAKGMDTRFIAEVTGLTEEKIDELRGSVH